jgi:hypothetical protein
MNQTKALHNLPFEQDEWQKLYYRHQQQYIRHRLSAIQLLHQGNSRIQVCEQIGCSYDTLTSWREQISPGWTEGISKPD